jgi:hypothetical protein
VDLAHPQARSLGETLQEQRREMATFVGTGVPPYSHRRRRAALSHVMLLSEPGFSVL